jgi:peptidoglycan-associated lipoprotein
VKHALTLSGAREVQIESVSLGEEKPRATGHDESSWAENRRTDIRYQGE